MLDKSKPYKILITSNDNLRIIYDLLVKLGYKFYNTAEFYIEAGAKIFYPEPNQWSAWIAGCVEGELVVEYDIHDDHFDTVVYGVAIEDHQAYTELTISKLKEYLSH